MERGNSWIKLPGLRMWDSNASKFPRSSEAGTLARYSFVDRIKDLTEKRKGLKKKQSQNKFQKRETFSQ